MRSRLFWLFMAAVVIAFSLPASAQEKEKAPAEAEKKDDKDASKLYVDLSGVMYLEWAYFSGFKYTGSGEWGKVYRWGINADNYYASGLLTDITGAEPTNYSKKNNNTFRMRRVYLTLKKQIGEMFSVKVTTDIEPTGQDFIYLKYGFVQFLKNFGTPVGDVELKAQLGKIATPVIGMTDYLNDLRWLGPNYLNNSKQILNGKSFDDSADLGGVVSLTLFKMLRMEYSLTNGEGYKADNNETYGGKAHTLLVSVNPVEYLKEVYVNFYGRWEDTNKNKLDIGVDPPIKYRGVDQRNYMGFGVAWYSDLIKFGLNFFAPVMQYSQTVFASADPAEFYGYRSRHKEKFLLIDSWLNVNIGAITPAGVIIVGRCAYGKELKSMLGNDRQSRETIVLAGGAGYQFSKYFRMVLYYENTMYRLGTIIHDKLKRDPTSNNNVYIKAEVKY